MYKLVLINQGINERILTIFNQVQAKLNQMCHLLIEQVFTFMRVFFPSRIELSLSLTSKVSGEQLDKQVHS